MDPDVPAGSGGFFPGMLGDLLRLLKTDSPLQWDLALQLAQTIAAEGDPAPNAEPVERIHLEELLGVAELHVAEMPLAPRVAREVLAQTTSAREQSRNETAMGPVDAALPREPAGRLD